MLALPTPWKAAAWPSWRTTLSTRPPLAPKSLVILSDQIELQFSVVWSCAW